MWKECAWACSTCEVAVKLIGQLFLHQVAQAKSPKSKPGPCTHSGCSPLARPLGSVSPASSSLPTLHGNAVPPPVSCESVHHPFPPAPHPPPKDNTMSLCPMRASRLPSPHSSHRPGSRRTPALHSPPQGCRQGPRSSEEHVRQADCLVLIHLVLR